MPALTAVDVVNQALRLIGDQPITALTDATERADRCESIYATTRDQMMMMHPWNFAMVRTVLRSYTRPATTLTPGSGATVLDTTGVTFTTGTTGIFYTAAVSDVGKRLQGDGVEGEGLITSHVSTTPAATLTPGTGALTAGTTGVNFTASAAVFASGDVGKVLENLVGTGVATITSFTSTTIVVATINEAFPALTAIASASWQMTRTDQVLATITQAFASTSSIASQSWRLENAAPEWGYSHKITVPSDCLRLWRVGDDRSAEILPYQREGGYFVTDETDLSVRYISQVTDPASWPPTFVTALRYHLAAVLSDSIPGKADRMDRYYKLYESYMRMAKMADGQEGSYEQTEAGELVTVRWQGGTGGVTGPKTRWW